MTSRSRNVEEKEVLNFYLISNLVKQCIFKAILDIAYQKDPSGPLLMILPQVIMIQDVRKCYNCKIGGIGDMEIREAYKKLYENGVLKEQFKIVERKGLMCALYFLTIFKTKWIKIVLS